MKSSRSKPAVGFTLIEVVIGLTLMATVVVSSLLAFSAHRKQRRAAEAKLAAVTVADDLLHRLSAGRDGIPIAGRGVIPGHPYWFWQTTPVGTIRRAEVPLRVIEFRIVEVSDEGRLPLVRTQLVKKIDR